MKEKIFYKDYKEKLIGQDRDRYEKKIQFLDGLDPCEVDVRSLSQDHLNFPDVRHGDIHQYLVNTTNAYSMEQTKAYKSEEAHNFFTNGWVQEVAIVNLAENKILVFGKVRNNAQFFDVI